MGKLNGRASDMTGLVFDCSCGRVHRIEINHMEVGSGAVNKLPFIMKDFQGKKAFVAADKNTYAAAGETVENKLKEDYKITRYIFNDTYLVPDENALGRLLIEIPEDTSVILGIGSGTINDICRFLSFKFKIPYVIVCTAPSMDGYASTVSPLVVKGIKTTYNAVYPLAIIADTDMMKKAPMRMLHAGLGDILGKYTALADWHLAKILNGEYFCSTVEKMVLESIDKCIKVSTDLCRRDPEAVLYMVEALIGTGLAIGMVGSSRPASGEEHHLSHCWEAMTLSEGKPDGWLHGNYVGVGTGIIIEAYKYLAELDIRSVYESGAYLTINEQNWAKNLVDVYGKNAGNIIEYKKDCIAFDPDERKKRMLDIMANWNSIKEVCEVYLPEPEKIRGILEEAGAAFKPGELGLDRERFKKSFIAAKDIRKRYGVLQLLEDIGMLEEAAERLANVYYE